MILLLTIHNFLSGSLTKDGRKRHNGGRKEGKDRTLQRRRGGRFDGDTGTSDEHEGEIVTKGNQISFKIYYICSLTDFVT